MTPIKVAVHGVMGKMGQEVLKALCQEDDMVPVGGADLTASAESIELPNTSGFIPISTSLEQIVVDAKVVVDFTNAQGALSAMRTAASRNVNIVIGSTGVDDQVLNVAENLAEKHKVGIVIAPNFAVGAVLMTHLVKKVARYFDYADLTETHHEAKIDSPSGTALAIVKSALEGKKEGFNSPVAETELVPGTRGGTFGGVSIHSVRIPGRVAHHDMVFGALGQTLTIRHDSINRESFMPGVMMAVRHVTEKTGLTVGLDKVMGI